MSEEILSASIVVPQTIIRNLVTNRILGFAMVLVLMFCIGDVQAALDAQETLGYPFVEIFYQTMNSVACVTKMVSLIICL